MAETETKVEQLLTKIEKHLDLTNQLALAAELYPEADRREAYLEYQRLLAELAKAQNLEVEPRQRVQAEEAEIAFTTTEMARGSAVDPRLNDLGITLAAGRRDEAAARMEKAIATSDVINRQIVAFEKEHPLLTRIYRMANTNH